jgi:hypothetical protein
MMNMNVHAQASIREKERENRTQVTARTVTGGYSSNSKKYKSEFYTK